LVDRGPNSAGCVDLVMEIEKKTRHTFVRSRQP
jgi:hypothetical protein